MGKKISSIPESSLASLSAGRYMLRAAGERKNLPYSSHRDNYYLFGVMLSGHQTVTVDFRGISIEEQQALIIAPGQVHGAIGNPSDSGFIIAFLLSPLVNLRFNLLKSIHSELKRFL